MSIIQTLRGRGSVFVTILLIIGLVAFIFMDSFQNIGDIFRDDPTLIADVNGERIETQKYSQELAEYEEQMRQNQNKESLTDAEQESVRTQFWNTKLTSVLINQECDLLGLTVTDKERNAMFTSATDVADEVRSNFTDPKTGIFNPQQVIQYEKQLSESQEPQAQQMRRQWGRFKEELVKQRRVQKYIAMVKQGIYIPQFMLDEMAKQNYVTANIEYVKVPYEAVDAKNIKISDAEIKDYMSSRSSMYTTDEDAVSMEYVSFPITPSSADTMSSLGFLTKEKEAFAATETPFDFASDKTDKLADDKFYNATTMMNANKETLLASGVGSVVGPYFDQDGGQAMYKLTRIIEKKSLPDSVRASHILIQPSETLTQEQAEVIADSILDAVKKGANFAALAKSRSVDQGSAEKGGDLGFFAKGMMVPEFEEFAFSNVTGKIDKVKSKFGFHIIKITNQKAFQPNIKVATIAKILEAGNDTKSKAQEKANKFVTEAKDEASFNSAAKKQGMDKRIAKDVKSTQGIVQGLGNVRDMVRWAYANEVGAISPAQLFNDKLVVARVTSKSKKGELKGISSVRPEIESVLRRRKQVEMVAAKAKTADLTAIAAIYNTEVKTADSIKMMGMSNPDLGYEPKVLSAGVNKQNLNKVSTPIPGQAGIYFVKTKAITDNMKKVQRIPQMERMQAQGQYMNSIDQFIPVVLKKRAKLNDNRSVSLNY